MGQEPGAKRFLGSGFTTVDVVWNHRQSVFHLRHLYNRRELLDLLCQTCLIGQSSAIALIGINNFKKINDTFGHLNGDKTLLCLVETLKHLISMSDSIVRFGGDEFILLFRDCSNNGFCKHFSQAKQGGKSRQCSIG